MTVSIPTSTPSLRIAINGMGRIGRGLVRALCASKAEHFSIVAINDVMAIDLMHHLLIYDSIYRPLPESQRPCLTFVDGKMYLSAPHIGLHALCLQQKSDWPWRELNIDCVIEASGKFRTAEACTHLIAGAKRVVVTAPMLETKLPELAHFMPHIRSWSDEVNCPIISTLSCTTHALAAVLKPLINHKIEIESVMVSEIHGATSDQQLQDGEHRDWRRARSALHSFIPTETPGIQAIKEIYPELEGKVQGHSIRVPVANVAAIEIHLVIQQEITHIELQNILYEAAQRSNATLGWCDVPAVSCDFTQHHASAIIDTQWLQVHNRHLRIFAWYDNEWGYIQRLLDLLRILETVNPN
ncbi:MAG: glyceraldehyde 3-phosphate dehydrogenase NAD-binding domain-containing protein [Pseudomonadota bacterium]